MMDKWIILNMTMCLSVLVFGCSTDAGNNQPTGLAADVAARASTVVDQIGGDDGFGGLIMDDYESHMEDHMGFHGEDDLADDGQMMTVEFRNESDQDSTFHLVYMASHMGIEDQESDVDVPAGEVATLELPCSEIIGLGSLTIVGEEAVDLADGTTLDNQMCVPGFLGADYQCDGVYSFTLMEDVDDLDEDGDTEELIVITEGLQLHMGSDGVDGHDHMTDMMGGMSGGMMGGRGGGF